MKRLVSEAIETPFDLPEAPEGWQIALMEEISQIVGGGTPKTTDNENFSGDGYSWITPADLSGFNGMYIGRGKRSLSEQGLKTSSAILMPKGTVLMSSRAPIGYHAIAANELCTNQGFKNFLCYSGVVPEYVFFWLKFISPFLEQMGSGSTFLEISGSRARKIPILLAPTSEQKRIVVIGEELLARVNTTKECLAKVPLTLKRFRQAVLAAACSGRLTTDWREKHPEIEAAYRSIQKLKERNKVSKPRRDVPTSVILSQELTEYQLPTTWMLESTAALLLHGALIDVKDGNHGSNHPKRGEFCDEGCPFITAAQVKNYQIDYEGAPKVTGEPLKRLRVGFAEIGDAILTHKGSIGRAALNTQPCVLTPQTTYYRCNREVLDPRYLVYFLTSPQFFQQLAGVMSQTTRDFVPISEQYHLFIFLPPLTEQQEIIRRVESMFKLADAVEKRVAAATARIEKLSRAILAKAFRGELGPTEAELARREGRSYETASELLARIKSEKDTNVALRKDPHGRGHKKRSK